MIRRLLLLLLGWISFWNMGCSQPVPDKRPPIENPKFDATLSHLLSFSVPLIGVDDLKNIQNDVVIFDAREKNEYDISHIPGAKYLGYDDFNPARLGAVDKHTPIVVYCSVGYRSEKVGEKLQRLGFSRVYNLYGSIFEWVNRGNPVVDSTGQITHHLHTYNKSWSQWVDTKEVEKIW